MRIELGHLSEPGKRAYRPLPRFLFSLHRRQGERPGFILGRLYRGYVGLIWNTPFVIITIWIAKECR